MTITTTELIIGIAALIFSALIAFTTTPVTRVLAYKWNAIDVPKDNRRMHKVPIPLMGGLAIFLAFTITTMIFCDYSPLMLALWLGGFCLTVLGIFDDIYSLNSWLKFVVQIVVSLIPVSLGVTIKFIYFAGEYHTLGWLEIPLTVLWLVGLTNAINLIDGLDGLSCGVSAICSFSLLLVTLTMSDNASALLTAILCGACLGFLPFNSNPAKIFMGDTGALFLGYTLATLSIGGVFKLHTVVSFMIPLSIFGLPLFDTTFAFIRRICHGQSPFKADRGHIHHRLIDMGFNVKQSVYILYAVCGILGISALMFTSENLLRAAFTILVGLAIFGVNLFIVKNPKCREKAGLDLPPIPDKTAAPESAPQEVTTDAAPPETISGESAAAEAPAEAEGRN